MIETKFVDQNKWLADHTLLLAISGGIDSMVMLYLFIKEGFSIEVAHVDHHTREGQSTQDSAFVNNYCLEHSITYHQGDFFYKKGNFQNEARNFRRKYFKDICEKRNLDYIATAHHMDDVVENYVLASFRGSHLHRLVTPLYQEGKYIRPLLKLNKAEIKEFADTYNIPFREDISNNEEVYTRNFIRNQVLPQIYSKIPQGKKGIEHTLLKLKVQDHLFTHLVDLLKNRFLEESNSRITIDLDFLKVNNVESILPFILSKYGFSEDQLVKMPFAQTGAQFKSNSHEAVIHRNNLIISLIQPEKENATLFIPGEGTYSYQTYEISIFRNENLNISNPLSSFQVFNLDLDDFPLEVRRIQPGDRIYPSRLKGRSVKIFKALTDLNIDRLNKKNTLIISTSDRVLWAYPYIVSHKRRGTKHGKEFYIDIKQKN
jgi:tRNA(Ile)-lysidine synthase